MDGFLEEKKQALLRRWEKGGIITDRRLIEAFIRTPREKFVLKADLKRAYDDYPLEILNNQTISQPTTVMLMSQALRAAGSMKILEVGTGSGYQAAILSGLLGEGGRITSIEYFLELADFARGNLGKTGCTIVRVIHGDGGQGYAAEAPYDRIIVTCACPSVPPPLLSQLKVGGILVIPVKKPPYDDMQVIKRTESGIHRKSIGAFFFVPLLGKYG